MRVAAGAARGAPRPRRTAYARVRDGDSDPGDRGGTLQAAWVGGVRVLRRLFVRRRQGRSFGFSHCHVCSPFTSRVQKTRMISTTIN